MRTIFHTLECGNLIINETEEINEKISFISKYHNEYINQFFSVNVIIFPGDCLGIFLFFPILQYFHENDSNHWNLNQSNHLMQDLNHIISLFDYSIFLLRPIHHSSLCHGLRHNHNSLDVLFSNRKIDNCKPAMETTSHFDIFLDIRDLLCCPIKNKSILVSIMVKTNEHY